MAVRAVKQVGAHHRGLDLRSQLHQTVGREVELVVAQTNGIVAHLAHHIDDILSARQSTRCSTLQEVTTGHHADEGCIADGIAQTSQFCVALDGTMNVVLVEHHDVLLGQLLWGRKLFVALMRTGGHC